MPQAARNIVFALAILAISALAHARLLRAGWLAGDLPHLAAATRATGSFGHEVQATEKAGFLEDGLVRPIAGRLLIAHAHAFGDEGAFSRDNPRALRCASWLFLLALAAGAGSALRRALLPWVGRDQARAAGFALALLVSTHPLGTAAIARPLAQGDLVALALAALAANLFLRGRQESEKRSVVAAAALVVVAGFASSVALLAAPVFAGLELGSARRARPFLTRVRTAVTTYFVFGACALFEGVVALFARVPNASVVMERALPDLPREGEWSSALVAGVEKLGILFLPVPGREGGEAALWPYYLVSAALALFALQPVLRSARSAPRLWGWFALAWLAVLTCALVPHAGVRVKPADYSRAEILIPAAIFACAGLAVASTALQGTRRVLIPFAMSLGFAWMGHAAARGYEKASIEVRAVRADLVDAYKAIGPSGHVLVIDPLERAGGLDPGLASLEALVEPTLGASPFGVDAVRWPPRRVVRAALPLLSRQAEFATWRADGLTIVAPRGALVEDREPRSEHTPPREIVRIGPTEGTVRPPVAWRDKGRSEIFDLDPSLAHFARMVALPETSTAEAPRIAWRARGPTIEPRSTGVWLEGADGPIAVFDLAREYDWWSARTIARVWTEGALVSVATAELVRDVPLDVREPRVRDSDWEFDLALAARPRPLHCQTEYVLELLDMESLEYARIECATSPSSDGVAALRAPGADGFERARKAQGGGPIAWSLEARCGEIALARASGRR